VSGSATPDLSLLPERLAEEVALLRDFLDLLEREERALVGGDIERLLSLVEDKNRLFVRLAGLGETRDRTLAAAGFGPGRQGMEDWLERQSETEGAKRDWQQLLALAEKARALNRSNGKLIATRLANNQQALSTLMAAANQASLYGPDGQTRPAGGGRSLGSA
jgi:flagella synthesis protein FlgN